MYTNKRLVIIASLLLAAIWAIWCIFFLPKGLDFTDEGLYCSEAWRLAHGDRPFVDSFIGSGLSFWFLSWVFRICPECSLLGLRVAWAIVMLLCALVTANLMLKHFSPVVSFTGAAVSLFFVTGGAIKVLSYNSMPILGLLLVAWLWLTAIRQSGRIALILAGGAGILAFLATSCRVSLLPIVFLPILTIAYDRCCRVKMDGQLRATIAFVAAYLGGLACFFLILFIAGMAGEFSSSLMITTSVPGHSLKDMIFNLRDSGLYYFLPTLPILAAVFIKRFKGIVVFVKKHSKTAMYIAFPILVACIFIIILDWTTIYKVLGWLKYDALSLLSASFTYSRRPLLLLLALAIGVVLADVIFHIFDSANDRAISRTHDRCRLGIIAIFLSFLMILGTNNVPAYSVRDMSWLLIPMAFGLSWLWVIKQARHASKTRFVRLLKGALIALLLLYTFYGILPNSYPYRDSPTGELDTVPAATKLHGILTTNDRADTVDRLIEAVKLNSEAGDRILAYENLPMLYYLTDRLPSTTATWLTEIFPKSLRESILEDMINRDRLPQVVIRATYTTRHPNWPTTQHPLRWEGNQQETDPIDKYVTEHYQVIQEIDGFQVMVPVE